MRSLYPSNVEITIGEDPPRQLLEEPEGWTSCIEFVNHPVTGQVKRIDKTEEWKRRLKAIPIVD